VVAQKADAAHGSCGAAAVHRRESRHRGVNGTERNTALPRSWQRDPERVTWLPDAIRTLTRRRIHRCSPLSRCSSCSCCWSCLDQQGTAARRDSRASSWIA